MPATKSKAKSKKSSKGLIGSRFRFNKLGALAIAAVLSVAGAVYIYQSHAASGPRLAPRPSSTNLITQSYFDSLAKSTIAPPNIINYPPTVRLGNTNPAVRGLQQVFYQLGDTAIFDYDGEGHFGAHTLAEVKAVQLYNHLTVDGIVGPQTWRVLFTVLNLVDSESSIGAPPVSNFSLTNDGKGLIKLRTIKVPTGCRYVWAWDLSKYYDVNGEGVAQASPGHSQVLNAVAGPNIIMAHYLCGIYSIGGASAFATIQN